MVAVAVNHRTYFCGIAETGRSRKCSCKTEADVGKNPGSYTRQHPPSEMVVLQAKSKQRHDGDEGTKEMKIKQGEVGCWRC